MPFHYRPLRHREPVRQLLCGMGPKVAAKPLATSTRRLRRGHQHQTACAAYGVFGLPDILSTSSTRRPRSWNVYHGQPDKHPVRKRTDNVFVFWRITRSDNAGDSGGRYRRPQRRATACAAGGKSSSRVAKGWDEHRPRRFGRQGIQQAAALRLQQVIGVETAPARTPHVRRARRILRSTYVAARSTHKGDGIRPGRAEIFAVAKHRTSREPFTSKPLSSSSSRRCSACRSVWRSSTTRATVRRPADSTTEAANGQGWGAPAPPSDGPASDRTTSGALVGPCFGTLEPALEPVDVEGARTSSARSGTSRSPAVSACRGADQPVVGRNCAPCVHV